MKIAESVKRAGLDFAKQEKVIKPCPKDGGVPMLFAGEGMCDYEIICYSCGFGVTRNSLKATIQRWIVATSRAKSEVK
jgi:hypothetical protein